MIQIFGAQKCFDTKKAERYFKERKIPYQYVDLLKYGLSKGEFEAVKAAAGFREMINNDHKDYKTLNFDKLSGGDAAKEILFKNPRLYKTPIVRNGAKATVGYRPEIWEEWITLK